MWGSIVGGKSVLLGVGPSVGVPCDGTHVARAANRLRQRGVQAGQCRSGGPCPLGACATLGTAPATCCVIQGCCRTAGIAAELVHGVHRSGPCSYFNILLPCDQGATMQAAAGRPCRCPRPSYAPGPLCCFGTILLCFLLRLRGFNTVGGLAQVLGVAHHTGRSPSVKACEIHTL